MTTSTEPSSRPGGRIDSPISWEPSLAFLTHAIAALLVGAAGFLLVILALAPDQTRTLRVAGPVLVALVATSGWFFLSRGRVLAAINVLAFGGWATITGLAVFNGGVRTPVVYAYPAIILMIGWLISSRAALAATALTIVATAGFVLAESLGSLPTPPPTLPAMHGVVQITMLVVSASMIVLLVRSYQNRLKELGRIGDDLAQRTIELEASRADLHRAQAVARVGSWIHDIATDTTRLSAETCRIFGLPEDTTGSHDCYLARVHAQDRGAVDAIWQEALKGAPLDHEHRIMVGEDVRWIRQKAEFEFAADGAPLRAVGTAQDITERKSDEEYIYRLAYYDPLTRLPNRRLLRDRIKQALAACARSGRGGALFFIDLDNFKTLNDTLGHDIGDFLLQQVAQRLESCVREVDTVARLGGDEFVVLLADLGEKPGQAAGQAWAVGEKVLAALNQPQVLAGHAHHSTASIGITLFARGQATVNDLLKQADIAMYQAKAAGRNTLSFFEPILQASDEGDAVQHDLFRGGASQ